MPTPTSPCCATATTSGWSTPTTPTTRTRIAALRGGGVELRVHDVDPDVAVAAAQKHGYGVLEPPSNKPHGLREAYILDADGYVWVPDTPSLSKWTV